MSFFVQKADQVLNGEEREEKGQNEVDFSFLKGENLENNLDNNLEDNLDNNTLEAAAVKESDSYSLQVYMSDGQVCFPSLSEI